MTPPRFKKKLHVFSLQVDPGTFTVRQSIHKIHKKSTPGIHPLRNNKENNKYKRTIYIPSAAAVIRLYTCCLLYGLFVFVCVCQDSKPAHTVCPDVVPSLYILSHHMVFLEE